jgi:hypothetical protein
VLIGLLLASAASLSCIFEPRATTEPTQVGGKDILPAQEPEMVVSNLVTILQALDSANYPELFSEDFYFVPDPEDVDFMNNYYGPGIYLDWVKPVEVYVAGNLFDRLNYALLDIEDTEVVENTEESYVVYHQYTLKILPPGGTWAFFSGRARFHMRPNPEDGLWEMYQWNDFRLEDAPDSVEGTWGLLKGETRATT